MAVQIQPTTQIRVGIVGLGDIARVHGACLERNPAFEIVAGYDLSETARAEFAARFGAVASSSFDELLDMVDMVWVCTPNAHHASYTVEALQRGKIVFCEKPPASSVADARRMRDVAAETLALARERFPLTATNLSWGLVYRHVVGTPAHMSRERLGEPFAASATWLRSRGVPGRGGFTVRALSGGGALLDIGLHVIDAVMHGLRLGRPLEVMAITNSHVAKRTAIHGYGPYDAERLDVETFADVTIRFAGAVMLHVRTAFASNLPGAEGRDIVAISGDGTRSSFHQPLHYGEVDPGTLTTVVAGEDGGNLVETVSDQPAVTVQQGYGLQVDHLAEVVLQGAAPVVEPDDGVLLMQLMRAAYASAELAASDAESASVRVSEV